MDKVKKLALSLCFILILGFMLNVSANILEEKTSVEDYSEFWENSGEYDVWFLGNSHVHNSIYPMELWDRYGIRSYNLAASASNMPQTYWTLMCALEYSRPKVILLDVYKVQLDVMCENEEIVHYGMDSIPLSGVKIKGICDVFDTWEKRFEYICPFSIYHNRWEELTKRDFNFQPSPMKGAKFNNNIRDNSKHRRIDKENTLDNTDIIGFIYLEKIIEECKKQGIDLVLTAIPFCGNEIQQRALNTIPEFTQGYDVPYLYMAYENILDYEVDFADRHHTNLFGAKKVTRYIGDYLMEHYDLTDYRGSGKISEKWDKDFEHYLDYKRGRMCTTNEIKPYVQWLSDDRCTCYLYQEEEPKGQLAKEFAQLNNIIYISREEAEERMGEKIQGEYAFFVENEKGDLLDTAVFKKGQRNAGTP